MAENDWSAKIEQAGEAAKVAGIVNGVKENPLGAASDAISDPGKALKDVGAVMDAADNPLVQSAVKAAMGNVLANVPGGEAIGAALEGAIKPIMDGIGAAGKALGPVISEMTQTGAVTGQATNAAESVVASADPNLSQQTGREEAQLLTPLKGEEVASVAAPTAAGGKTQSVERGQG